MLSNRNDNSEPHMQAGLSVLEGWIEPGQVFDRVMGLDEVPEDYRAMDECRAIKVLVRAGRS